MGFATQYLTKNRMFGDFIFTSPERDLKFIVVIPCYNEDRMLDTLNALWNAKRPNYSVEILVVVNASLKSPEYIVERNRLTIKEIEVWKSRHVDERFALHSLDLPGLPEKEFGAGVARKIGMDEAISRFNGLDNQDGYIISLDADTTVAKNYFEQIEACVFHDPRINAGILYFEHPTHGDEFSSGVYEAVARYELFLRYYNLALRWTGFPYAFHTIGSAFFVKALAYVKQGGMIRRKAGEDFYFLNKVFQLGNISEVNATSVYPSPRRSGRVLFGTGPEVERIIQNGQQPYLTYHIEAFQALRGFFSGVDRLFHCSRHEAEAYLNSLEPGLGNFLQTTGFFRELKRINDNCNRPEVFRKHFFQWFGKLKIIRYMHVVHEEYLDKVPLENAVHDLLERLDHAHFRDESDHNDVFSLLNRFRQIERSGNYRI